MTGSRRRLAKGSRDDAVVGILLDGRLVGSPVAIYDLLCVALTKQKRRCQRPVEWSQHAYWAEPWAGLRIYDVEGAWAAGLPEEQLRACFRRQRCTLHVFSDEPDAVSLELFDLGLTSDSWRDRRENS